MKRRSFLAASLGMGFVKAAPAIVRAASDRPQLNTGIATGDVTSSGTVLWSRANQPFRLVVELSRDDTFKKTSRLSSQAAYADSDYNIKLPLAGLSANTDWFYRVRAESLETGLLSAPLMGHFKTAPAQHGTDIRFCWSGDTAGQGYGIDQNHGGMLTYKSMLAQNPDFLVHSGDQIYADAPLQETMSIGHGRTWKNILTPGKIKVAETTQEFRENYYYNFLDEHLRAFHAQVPVFCQWDDHEVVNNWYPGEILESDDRYSEKRVTVLAERSRRAMFECLPIVSPVEGVRQIYRKRSFGPLLDMFFLDMRSYRGPNSRNLQTVKGPDTAFIGDVQLEWLKNALQQSRATWKIICSDMPLGLIVRDGKTDIAENGANGDGPPLGRELEIAELLSFIARENIVNVHFITADVHYCASHYYNPHAAQFKNFKPFWEFVSGPLHAGTFGPSQLDNTFGPEVKFVGIPKGMQQNRSPADGFQFFGLVDIDADSRIMRVAHHNRVGDEIWSMELQPEEG